MSRLTIYADTDAARPLETLEAPAAIATALQAIGVHFRRLAAAAPLSADASEAEVLAAYRAAVDEERAAHGYQSVDVVRMTPESPNVEQARSKFLAEHTHTENEARIMALGSGCFYLRAAHRVHQVECTAGDLISVPEGTRHWFDMGPRPSFVAIRFFIRADGWVGHFTGDDIASRYPSYEP